METVLIQHFSQFPSLQLRKGKTNSTICNIFQSPLQRLFLNYFSVRVAGDLSRLLPVLLSETENCSQAVCTSTSEQSPSNNHKNSDKHHRIKHRHSEMAENLTKIIYSFLLQMISPTTLLTTVLELWIILCTVVHGFEKDSTRHRKKGQGHRICESKKKQMC
jgi:hypothetical protein